MGSICHLFPFRPYVKLICGGYAGNMRALYGQFTFYQCYKASFRTALCNKYPIFLCSKWGAIKISTVSHIDHIACVYTSSSPGDICACSSRGATGAGSSPRRRRCCASAASGDCPRAVCRCSPRRGGGGGGRGGRRRSSAGCATTSTRSGAGGGAARTSASEGEIRVMLTSGTILDA